MFAPTHLGYDDGGYGLAAIAMRQGYEPFRDIFSPQGPLFLPLVHVADRVGLSHMNAPRLLPVLAGIVVTLAVYAIGVQTMDRGRALLAAALAGGERRAPLDHGPAHRRRARGRVRDQRGRGRRRVPDPSDLVDA